MPSRLTFCGVRRVARGSGDAHHVTRAIGQARPLIRAAARSQTGPRQLPRTQPPPCVGRLHWVPGRTAATARLYRRPSPSRRCPARRPRPATAPTRNPSSPTHPFLLPFASPPPTPQVFICTSLQPLPTLLPRTSLASLSAPAASNAATASAEPLPAAECRGTLPCGARRPGSGQRRRRRPGSAGAWRDGKEGPRRNRMGV